MQPSGSPSLFHSFENALTVAVVAAMTAITLSEVVAREFLGTGIPGSIPMVQHLTLCVTFLGAGLAARSDRLLALSTASFLRQPWRRRARGVTSALAVAVTICLLLASIELLRVDLRYGDEAAWGIPVWCFTLIMVATFALMSGRIIRRGARTWRGRLGIAVGLAAPLLFVLSPDAMRSEAGWLVAAVLLVGTALGMPIYAVIGGAAMLLFWLEGTPISAVAGEAYRMSTEPMLPAIPLFTLAGYILAEGGASRRLLRLFSALVGWMPGGLAVVTTLVLAFFTPLTGASGITILAMGGLLLPMMTKARYTDRNAVGLVTVSGSIGVLFPPSLPVILYAYYAELPIEQLFVAGLLPGVLLVAVVAGWGAWRGWRDGAVQTPFRFSEALAALWTAKWEVLLPLVVLAGIFGGVVTLVEAAAATVLYALLVECLIFRELSIIRDVPRVALESATLIGGFMIILGVALGFTNYLIIAQVPMHALTWVQQVIDSPYLFLLAVNVLLIVVGALMDIYSAIIVIAPLIIPMAGAYQIDPVHLGVVFLANMQLGYLMPPMGENLFLSSYRFERPLADVYRCTIPYVLLLLAAVLAITYVPLITLWLPRALGL